MPIVSIITPTYNHEKYIASCIESVLAQSFKDWEMIILDDASTDQTPGIIAQYAEKDKRIRFIGHPCNWGKNHLAASYNEALNLAQGKYLAIIEGDDGWPAHKLAAQLSYFESRPDAVLSHGRVALIIENDEVKIPSYPWPPAVRENRPIGSAFKALLLGENPIHSQTVLIRRKYLEKIGGFKPESFPSLVTDYPTWLELTFEGEFIFIPKILGYWRRYSASLSSHYQEELWRQHIEYARQFLDSHRQEWLMLPRPIQEYAGYASCSAFLDLCKLRILDHDYAAARVLFQRLRPCRKAIFRDRLKTLKFLTLWVCISTRVNIYKFLLRFYKKHKWYRGVA